MRSPSPPTQLCELRRHEAPPSLSEGAIALATRMSRATVAQLLADDRRRGVVVRTETGWCLSTTAERAFGQALRELGDGPIVIGRRARRRSD